MVEVADMGKTEEVMGMDVFVPILDGIGEIVVGNSSGIRPTVHVFDTSNTSSPVRTFLPFSDGALGGVSIALGKINLDDIPDLIELVQQWTNPDWIELFDNCEYDVDCVQLLPVSAWRALACLQAKECAPTLLAMFCSPSLTTEVGSRDFMNLKIPAN